MINRKGLDLKLILKDPVHANNSEPAGRPGDGVCGGLCACFDSPDGTKKVVTHNPPRLYNIEEDPGKNSPIDIGAHNVGEPQQAAGEGGKNQHEVSVSGFLAVCGIYNENVYF